MKVLIGIDSLIRGGKERRLLELIKGLTSVEHFKCELVIFSKVVEYEELSNLHIPVHYITRSFKKDPGIFIQVHHLIRRIKPDIIQSWSSMVSIFMLPSAKLLGIKFINAIIADAPYQLKPWSSRWVRTRLTFPFSDAIVGNSKAGLIAYNAPLDKSYCIYNGVSFNRFTCVEHPEKVRTKFNINTPYVVGKVASFRGAKDYETFIKAAMEVLDQRDDVTFLAVGEGRYLSRYKLLVDRKYNKIIFTGRQTDVESIINIFDIGVLITDYKVHGEGISNAILEYMALGKPVIATDTGGTSELLTEGVNGYFVENKNVSELAKRIIYLLDNPDKIEELGAKGKQMVYNDFSVEEMTENFISLYKKVLSKP